MGDQPLSDFSIILPFKLLHLEKSLLLFGRIPWGYGSSDDPCQQPG
jgi:hypothetical protein